MQITIKENVELDFEQVLNMYKIQEWSSSEKPDLLKKALENSHHVVSAWDGDKLIGLGNAISDGHLVVYYPHLLVLPDYQEKGIGKRIMQKMQDKYKDFHQQQVVADKSAVKFYKKCGFEISSKCKPMWIFEGDEH